MILKLINCLQEKNEKFNKNSSNKKIVVKIDQKQILRIHKIQKKEKHDINFKKTEMLRLPVN